MIAPVPISQVMITAAQVIDAREKIDELKQSTMFGNALVYRVIAQSMIAAGQKKLVIDDIEFHLEAPEEHEWCLCHGTRTGYCPTPHHERVVRVKKDLFPRFWYRKVKKESVAA